MEKSRTRVIATVAPIAISVFIAASTPGRAQAGSHQPTEGPTEEGKPTVVIETEVIGAPPDISRDDLILALSVRSENDFDEMPGDVQNYLATPVTETVIQVDQPVLDNETGLGLSSGSGQVGSGCWNTVVKKTRSNVLGWVLNRAETSALNWCNNGSAITNSPTGYRYANGYWGWFHCGWTYTYEGFLDRTFRWGIGGWARFAYGDTCFAPQIQLRNEIQIQADGKWYTWN